jgi:hypothetical protein
MSTTGPVQDMIEERRKQKLAAFNKLKELFRNKIELKRPVFFVPGWTDESCANWTQSFKLSPSIKDWFKKTSSNCEMVNFVTFTEQESIGCNSFIDFGLILKKKVESAIGNKKLFDIVGHSMGGLDIRTAIAMHDLECVENCITVATPHKGSQLGEIGPIFMKYKPQHKIQCINLDPDHLPVQTINSLQNRKKFLEKVKKLYQFVGTRDMAVARNAKIDTRSISSASLDKIITVEIGGVTHSANGGITRDVRVIIAIFNALMGIEPEKPKYNYGYIIKRV